ncbi:polysaccharide biosynthesis/export family protein [Paraburkholderia sp. IMGN_8]|uniref:polysaccharide biosynthesis/export family protein n=1 Tax=Paraburkholderia sp. IMGN_8 TaxID=3136564 RepID=UPI00310188CC
MKFDSGSGTGASDTTPPIAVTEIDTKLIQQIAQNDMLDDSDNAAVDSLIGTPASYRIGPADVLSVIVWDHPELVMPNVTYDIGTTGGAQPQSVGLASQSLPGYVVSHEGYIQFPYVKLIQVAGLTEVQAQQRLTQALKKYLNNPQISLRVVGFRSKKVFVNGEVHAPGVKPITDVPMTLANALHEAMGVLDSGSASHVWLTRAGKRYQIDVPRLAKRGIDATRIMLANGDEVRVPPATDFSVFVIGEVQKPGPVRFLSDGRLTLAQALGTAQLSQVTGDPSEIYLIRPPSNGRSTQVFHLNAESPQAMALAQQFALQSDDVVYVDAPGVVRWNRVVSQLVGGTAAAYNLQRATTGGW